MVLRAEKEEEEEEEDSGEVAETCLIIYPFFQYIYIYIYPSFVPSSSLVFVLFLFSFFVSSPHSRSFVFFSPFFFFCFYFIFMHDP